MNKLLITIVVAGMIAARPAHAAQESRVHLNSFADNLVFLDGIATTKQQFLDNFDLLNTVTVAVGGPIQGAGRSVFVKLQDSCGNFVAQIGRAHV